MTSAGHQRGLTLLELLLGFALSLVMLLMAVPAYQAIMASARQSTLITQVSASFFFSREQAVNRGANVFMCPGDADMGCKDDQRPSWNRGWIIYTGDGAKPVHGESLLKAHTFEKPWFHLFGIGGVERRIGFRPTGSVERAGSLKYCDYSGKHGVSFRISPTGRFNVERTGKCSAGLEG